MELVQYFIDNGADIHAKDAKDGQTPLHWAAKYSSEEVVTLLVQLGANMEAKDDSGKTPLLCACTRDIDEGYNEAKYQKEE